MKEQKDKGQRRFPAIMTIGILMVAVVSLWLALDHWTSLEDTQINTLFSALTLAVITCSILMQRKDLDLQHEELRATRRELKQQNRTLKYQRFDNTFFNLIAEFGRIPKSIAILQKIAVLKDCNNVPALIQEYRVNSKPTHWGDGVVFSLEKEVQSEFSVELKTFEAIVDFIDKSKSVSTNRKRYFKLFFAQINNFQLILFFYHFHLRSGETPAAFQEYRGYLFDSLHSSPLMPNRHHMMMMNYDW